MVVNFGKRIRGRLVEMPAITLGESVPGKVYEIHIKTTGVSDAESVVISLAEKLYDNYKANVVWAEVDNDTIKLQIIGSPFVWALLLPAIPIILSLLGVTMILIAVYTVFAAIPGWAWGLLATGVILVFVGPAIGRRYVR